MSFGRLSALGFTGVVRACLEAKLTFGCAAIGHEPSVASGRFGRDRRMCTWVTFPMSAAAKLTLAWNADENLTLALRGGLTAA